MAFGNKRWNNIWLLDRGLSLNPQYLVGEPGIWEGNPDFLAIQFPENLVWMVEVSKSPGDPLYRKIAQLRGNMLRE